MCVSLRTIGEHNTAQNSSDIFPLILRTVSIAEMMSTAGQGKTSFLGQESKVFPGGIRTHYLRAIYCYDNRKAAKNDELSSEVIYHVSMDNNIHSH